MTDNSKTPACWCGNAGLLPFSPDYGECKSCGTLVYLKEMLPEQLLVRDDENDFYGKKYWLEHQQDAFGYADIHTRARNDLTERNLHWLKTLFKYCLPPAKVLELGCSHGSFVALLNQSGYDATGVEMSPWVVEFGKTTFGVPIAVGPVESLDIPHGSLDVIALMDVLEHLPDPVATMDHCLKLLKPDGLLLIQTPQFKEGMDYSALVETNGVFLEQLKSDEHLYLFSEHSVTRLFKQLGAEYIQFEPAIFAHYDMFFVVSRTPLSVNSVEQSETVLQNAPKGRLVQALLDIRARELDCISRLQISEVNLTARQQQLDELTSLTIRLDLDLSARNDQLEDLTRMLKESEADRAARGEQIEGLTRMLKESEADRAARGEQIEELTRMLKESEADRAARGEQIEELTQLLQESEADRTARWQQIQTLTQMLQETQVAEIALKKRNDELLVILEEMEKESLVKNEQLENIKTDVQTLLARPQMQLLNKLSKWSEISALNEKLRNIL